MVLINPQEDFWKSKINLSYAQDNSTFDMDLGISAWKRILHRVNTLEINSYLDCGANIGRNIGFLKETLVYEDYVSETTLIGIQTPKQRSLKRNMAGKLQIGSFREPTGKCRI